MHIKEGQFDTTLASRVSEDEYRVRVARLEPAPGDIIFTREAPVGEAFVVPAEMKICLGQRVMLLRPDPSVVLGEYLVAQIYSGVVQSRIKLLTGGTTNPHLNVAEVRGFTIPIPPVEEQKALVEVLQRYEGLLQTEKGRLDKLESLKSGLSTDLLTGRVRVPDGASA
jgi:type I restriction enzyme S subunit